ncbi:centrosomal protein of 78 kDa-like isoform X2 [Dreissena polymorpha]|nr:centrosomal protein of 78 kDa-like isoform X2 [Dreissena polymorpha]XP_052267965.1 centrosomal protein of 78 kDa-like isoform X2 [Dreissena polymorpha]
MPAMIESVQVRQRGAYDFETHYDNLCALQDSCPLPAVKAHLSQGVLDLNGDRIRANDWMPVLNTLRINKSLEFVAIRSYYTPPSDENEKKALIEKRKTPSVRSKEITYRMCKALKECLGVTPTLTCLEIQGLPLRERDLNTLMKGLVKNATLNHFSLEYCRIGDTGLEIVCKGIKNSTSINSVNFTGCSLSAKGAESLAKVIKHQGTKRHNEAWRDSLRYRRPDLDRMQGIRRITINNNPMIGDQGAALLAEALKDDLWLKALDMQGNGISSAGAKSMLDVLKYNTTLVVLDVRRNPLIDRDLVHAIMEQLMINCNGQDTEYKWIKAEDPADKNKQLSAKKRRTKTLNSSFGRKTTIKITPGAARRRTRSAENVGVSRKMRPIGSETVKSGPGLPWRTAARANRYRGYPPEHIPGHTSLMERSETISPGNSFNYSSTNQTRDQDNEEEEETEDTEDSMQEKFDRIKLDDSALTTAVTGITEKGARVEMVQLRRQIQEERLARHKAEQNVIELTLDNKKLREETSRLKRNKGSILDDDSVLESIEASFKQFHEFLDLLRDAGLGKLITMAGLDSEDSPFNNTTRDHMPRFQKSFSKGVYSGDISSNGHVNGSFTNGDRTTTGNVRPKPYLKSHADDPTMKTGYIDDSLNEHDEAQRKRDELYERILQETSNAFKNIGEQDLTINITGETTQTMDETYTADDTQDQVEKFVPSKGTPPEKGGKSRIPRYGAVHRKGGDYGEGEREVRSERLEKLKGPGGEIIMTLSPFDGPVEGQTPDVSPGRHNDDDDEIEDDVNEAYDSRAVSPDKPGRQSEYSYGMDSFEQSYLSERGELVHLGDDLDDYPESPSPIQQESDNDDF